MVTVKHDPDADVLYVRAPGSIVTSEALHDDGSVIVNHGHFGMVGLQLLFISEMTQERWAMFTREISKELREAVYAWLIARDGACGRCSDCVAAAEITLTQRMQRLFIVCRTCGNKRCPRAKNHANECTNSNEPGQKGSDYQ